MLQCLYPGHLAFIYQPHGDKVEKIIFQHIVMGLECRERGRYLWEILCKCLATGFTRRLYVPGGITHGGIVGDSHFGTLPRRKQRVADGRRLLQFLRRGKGQRQDYHNQRKQLFHTRCVSRGSSNGLSAFFDFAFIFQYATGITVRINIIVIGVP